VGKDYWGGLIDWIKNSLLQKENNINEIDLELLSLVDTADEAVNNIEKFYSKYLHKPNF
jgi:predicted Rossmann-fold nucleotide-binding protein